MKIIKLLIQNINLSRIAFLFIVFLHSSCLFNHKIDSKFSYYKLDNSFAADSAYFADIAPYKQKIDTELETTVAYLENDLFKEQPVSNLGNWAADALSEWAKVKNYSIDFVVLNYGGLRLESIGKGPLKKGKIFELMPFDNSLVIVEMKGAELVQLFNHILNKGGWPVSKELKLDFSKSSNESVATVSGSTISPDKNYSIFTIDYLANGGDNCNFFKGKNRTETGVLLRSAMIEQLEFQKNKGIKVSAEKDNRILIKP